jgi:hypothetical protein
MMNKHAGFLQGALAIPLEDRGAQGGCRVYENNVNFDTLCHKPNIQYYRKRTLRPPLVLQIP